MLAPELLRDERQNLLARVANGIRVRRVLEAADEEHPRPRFEPDRRRLRPLAVGYAMGERAVVGERADQLRLRLRDGEHAVGGGVDVQLPHDLVPVVAAEERRRAPRRPDAESATGVAQELRVDRVDNDAGVGRVRSEQRSHVLGDLPEGEEGDVESR